MGDLSMRLRSGKEDAKMIRIAVVEDEKRYQEQLKKYLHQYEKEHSCSFALAVYTDGDEIVENYRCEYDIILLDIKMQFMDGMTAAEKIREKDGQVIIMFITNMTNYAIRGYEVDALDYILKPITYFAFAKKLDRAMSRLEKREEKRSVTIQVSSGIQKIFIEDICYIESDAHVLIFHTIKGEYKTYLNMKDMESVLSKYSFFRCNRGYLVNLKYVDGVHDGCASVNGDSLIISRAKKKGFMAALADYIGEE